MLLLHTGAYLLDNCKQRGHFNSLLKTGPNVPALDDGVGPCREIQRRPRFEAKDLTQNQRPFCTSAGDSARNASTLLHPRPFGEDNS